MKQADGYYKVQDFAQKLTELNLLTLQVEWFCEKIGRSDLVYGDQYDEAIHSPSNLPYFSPARPVYLSIDWGGSVFSIGVWQAFDIGWVRVTELYEVGTTNQRLIEKARSQPWWSNIKAAVADPARDDLIREWRDAGIPIIPAKNAVVPGIEATRNALRPVVGQPKFYVNPICKDWRREVMGYREKNGLPVKDKDHAMDETRYFVMWVIAAKPLRKGRVFGKTAPAVPPPELKKEIAPVEIPAQDEVRPAAPAPAPALIEPKGGFHVQRKGKVFGRY
jgi:hypothetical protein